MITEKMLNTVERTLAVTKEIGSTNYIFQDTKRLFDRVYDAEIYQRLTVAELAVFTTLLLITMQDAFDKADRDGKRIITL